MFTPSLLRNFAIFILYLDFIIKNKTYTSKTNLKGVAKIAIGLSPGEYDVLMVHPDGFEATKKITIKSSIKASKLEKHYFLFKGLHGR